MLKNNVESSYGFHESTPEFERLLRTCETVSNEAFGVNRITASLKDAFRFMTTWDYSKPEVINAAQIESVLKRAQYTDLDDVRINTPVGFKGDLNAYVAHLGGRNMEFIKDLRSGLLDPATVYFASFLNDPDSLRSRTPYRLDSKFTPVLLNELIQSEAKWTLKGNRNAEQGFTAVFENNRGCYEAMALLNTLNELRWDKANPSAIRDANKRLMETVNAVFALIEKDKANVSPVVMSGMTEVLHNAARWIEWYSVMCTRIMDATAALKLTEKKLLRVL